MQNEKLLNKVISDDNFLRPSNFSEYIGQNYVKDNLNVAMHAAKDRNEYLEHILLYGPPGLGKTSLAIIIAHEMNANVIKTTATSIKRVIDLFSLVMTLDSGDVLFIDEIHRLDKKVEEAFYSVMEDFQINIIRGGGRNIKAVSIPTNKFTLIGATTRAGLISKPLRDRFGMIFSLSFYSPEELIDIAINAAKSMKIKLNEESAYEIAKRSRGTPRIAINLVKRVRDFASVAKKTEIEIVTTDETFNSLQIDEYGLGEPDRKFLFILFEKRNKAVGLNTICAILNEDRATIEEPAEPYLLSIGFVEKTPRGRMITDSGIQYLKDRGFNDKKGYSLF
jgi:holliday junction DNA helicase RuvB